MSWAEFSKRLQFLPQMRLLASGAVYVGPFPPSRAHSHRTLQILLSPRDHGKLRADQGSDDTSEPAHVIVIPPFARHRVHAHLKPAVSLWYEPTALQDESSLASTQKLIKTTLNAEESDLLFNLVKTDLDRDLALKLFQFGTKISGLHLQTEKFPSSLDVRVKSVLEQLATESGRALSLSELARGQGLSTSRLTHLFTENLGIAFRSYVLWLKLRQAIQAQSSGMNLTDAAHFAGFSDSAHFSRIFSRTFGLTPSFLMLVRVQTD